MDEFKRKARRIAVGTTQELRDKQRACIAAFGRKQYARGRAEERARTVAILNEVFSKLPVEARRNYRAKRGYQVINLGRAYALRDVVAKLEIVLKDDEIDWFTKRALEEPSDLCVPGEDDETRER